MKSLSLGYSPCPNDTFIFYAMIHGRIDTDGIRFTEILRDIEQLNQMAGSETLDITKISFHAFGHLRDSYCLLRAGGALGRGCGPLVIARHTCSMKDAVTGTIAIPGKLTTAHLLHQLYCDSLGVRPSQLIVMPFHEIIHAVETGIVDTGVVIHESRFTYQEHGLISLVDLGAWWEQETGQPIPLGAIIAKRVLGTDMISSIEGSIRRSVEYALNNTGEPVAYIKEHSQELSDTVIRQHIDLYVNNFSLDLGEEGKEAVSVLFSKAEAAGIIPASSQGLFHEP